MKIALLVDFDGTIIETDLAEPLLNSFAVEDWTVFGKLLSAGKISVKECRTCEYSCLPSILEEEMTDFALNSAVIRPGFLELVTYCINESIPIDIVSGGMGFYIKPLLSHHGIPEIPVFSARADFDSGNRMRMDYSVCPLVCDVVGSCKCFHVQRYRDMGTKTVLIGDGSSDICAAIQADYVFARRKLQLHLEANNVPFVPFFDFKQILKWLTEPVTL